MMRTLFVPGLVLSLLGWSIAGPAAPPAPSELWSEFDPQAGDFRQEIVREETKNGVYERASYISVPVLGQDVRVYCLYAVKEGAKGAPGLLNVHGWMGAPAIARDYVADGWAVMSFDYCGKTGTRPHFTKYPEPLRHGNMDRTVCGPVRSADLDGKPITDPRQTSDFIWYTIQRRVLTYLERQKEVDPTRLGAQGYSYGGTIMWNLGTDPRVKAVVAYFGIFYVIKEPCSFTRSWRDAASERQGDRWVAFTPVMNVGDYLFAYANITYDNTIVLSTAFNAAIPAKLGDAKATDTASNEITSGGYSAWSNVAELEGPGGIKAFRCTNNGRGSTTEQLHFSTGVHRHH